MTRRRSLPVWALAGLLVAALPGAAVAEPRDPFTTSWAKVGLTWAPLDARLRNASCAESRDSFEACLFAVAAVAAAHDPPLLPVPAAGPFGRAAWSPQPARAAGDLPPYSLEARARRERGVAAVWAAQPTVGVDFEAMISWLQKALDPRETPALAARGIAAYLRRAVDPHTAIAPYHAVDAAYHHAPTGSPIRAFLSGRQGRHRGVESELVHVRGFQLVWVRVTDLDDVACFDVSSALATSLERGADAVMLDLRGNLGGVSREAACIADLFLPLGAPIVRLEPLVPDFAPRELRAQSGVIVAAPLVVLVDAWSASGAEVIAAAIQANGRGIVVGTRTFGKGTYQEAAPWPEHPDVVFYRTVARLVVASRFEFQMHGVSPDLEAPAPKGPEGAPALREDTAYANPIAARYPPVPRRNMAGVEACIASRPHAVVSRGSSVDIASQALWCWLSGTLPGS